MFTSNHRVVLAADTQARVDTFLSQIDTFLTLFNASSTSLTSTVTADTVKSFEGTLKSAAGAVEKTVASDTIPNFVKTVYSIANTFDRAIAPNVPKNIESALVNVEVITRNIRNFTNVVTFLLIALWISVVLNVFLVWYVSRKNKVILQLKDKSKKWR
ncbi:hypothetical protein K458DRAFT_406580 [Lentithecium fluviatile CBS 122367]|uniref:Uncharacterized protein n=1 Tax=Lentithecium fluviatile CBS 122367 TaxID=1168545 RepID=A0A6G1ISI9_9PLEO|nr:hypothetical protein K458DRAFT_406580 [Lentithecium fluviatile CBS 122367]